MPKNDIGGFFVSLGLDVDKNSFENGQKSVDSVSVSLNKLIGTARNAAVVMAAYKGITSAVDQSKESLDKLNQAEIFGSSAEKLNIWRAAAKIAGADANSLISSIGKLSNVMNHLTIDGSGLEAYAEQLGKLELGIEELEGMDPADAMQKIFEKAQSQLDGTNETKLRMTTIIGDILGDAGQELFVTLARNNQSIGSWLAGAAATQYQTDKGMTDSAKFAQEMNQLRETVSSIKKAIGDNLAGVLYDPVKNINKWFIDNKTAISNGIDKISNATQKLVDGIGSWWDAHGNEVLGALQNIGTGVSLIVTNIAEFMKSDTAKAAGTSWWESFKGAWSTGKNLAEDVWTGNWEKAYFDYLEGFEKVIVDPAKSLWNAVSGQSMKDGIMRPDGTITQVAPDDWVFAARNVGDLARAFIPQGAMAATSMNQEYTINQTFNVQGSGDIPAVIKQQAYRGTQNALMEAMEQSSRRMQLMSGTL